MTTSLNEVRRLFLEAKISKDIPFDIDIETAENEWLVIATSGTINDSKSDLLRLLFQTQGAKRWDDFLRNLGYSGSREGMLRQYYVDNT